MAKDSIRDYSATSSNNSDIQSVDISEGCAPSGLNNAIREVMTDLKNVSTGTVALETPVADSFSTDTISEKTSATGVTIDGVLLKDGAIGSIASAVAAHLTSINGGQIGGARNLAINGNAAVSQRGVSTTGVTSTGYHACDRFKFLYTDAGTWTVSQSTDAPDGFASSFKVECTTAKSSLASNSRLFILQALEGQNLQQLKKGTSSAESITLSFYVRTNKTGTYQVHVEDNDNIRIIGSTYTVSTANTWQKVTVTLAGDTTGALDNDNGDSFAVFFALVAGTDNSSGAVPTAWEAKTNADRGAGLNVNLADTTSNYWQITGLQMEIGETATPFEHESYGETLQKCQRYFYRTHRGASGSVSLMVGTASNSTTAVQCMTVHPVQMRDNPTITENGSLTAYDVGSNANANVGTNISSVTHGCSSFTTSGLTAYRPVFILSNSGSNFLTFSAEL